MWRRAVSDGLLMLKKLDPQRQSDPSTRYSVMSSRRLPIFFSNASFLASDVSRGPLEKVDEISLRFLFPEDKHLVCDESGQRGNDFGAEWERSMGGIMEYHVPSSNERKSQLITPSREFWW